jgi:hypothetical protein
MKELFRLLPKLLSEHEDNEAVREAVVFAVWRNVVGDSLRENTVPFRLYRKQLIVAVADERWKQHLERMSGQMIFKLNSALRAPEVTFIEFRIDEKTCAEARKEKKPQITEEEMWEIVVFWHKSTGVFLHRRRNVARQKALGSRRTSYARFRH